MNVHLHEPYESYKLGSYPPKILLHKSRKPKIRFECVRKNIQQYEQLFIKSNHFIITYKFLDIPARNQWEKVQYIKDETAKRPVLTKINVAENKFYTVKSA